MIPVSSTSHSQFTPPSSQDISAELERHLTEPLPLEERSRNFQLHFYRQLNDFDKYREFVNSLFTKYNDKNCWPFILFYFPYAFTHTSYTPFSKPLGLNAINNLNFQKPSVIRSGQEATPEEIQIFVERLANICMAIVENSEKFYPNTTFRLTISEILFKSVCETNKLHHLIGYLIHNCPPPLFMASINILSPYFENSPEKFISSIKESLRHSGTFPLNVVGWLDNPVEIANEGCHTKEFEQYLWEGDLLDDEEMKVLIRYMQSKCPNKLFLNLFHSSLKAASFLRYRPELFDPHEVLSFLSSYSFTPIEKLTALQKLLVNYACAGINATAILIQDPQLISSFKSIYTFENCRDCLRKIQVIPVFQWSLLVHINPEIIESLFISEAMWRRDFETLDTLVICVPEPFADLSITKLSSNSEYVNRIRSSFNFFTEDFNSITRGIRTLYICKRLFPDWETLLVDTFEKLVVEMIRRKRSFEEDYGVKLVSVMKTFKALQVLDSWIEKDLSMFSAEAQKVIRKQIHKL